MLIISELTVKTFSTRKKTLKKLLVQIPLINMLLGISTSQSLKLLPAE